MRFLLALIFIFSFTTIFSQKRIIPLSAGWQFQKKGALAWLPAKVPGVVHLDLLENQLIPDPFIGTCEDSVQWIEKETWIYQNTFEIQDFDTAKKYNLVFEGLDTYADVFLNGEKILTTENMFVTYSIEVGKYLRDGKNELRVEFHSPFAAKANYINDIYAKTAGNDASEEKISVYCRKAAFQFGWDWAPRLVTCGIWNPVYIEEWSKGMLLDVHHEVSALSEDNAMLAFQVSYQFEPHETVNFIVKNEAGEVVEKLTTLPSKYIPGYPQRLKIPISIKNPVKWEPGVSSLPKLYTYRVEMWSGERQLDARELKFGLRTIELHRHKDMTGEVFYFSVNGRPRFIKGANWVPMDPLLPRISHSKMRQLLLDAKEVGINMLRVWGGGIYEDDYFYDLCDSLGIMVWQDFMFACAMYPIHHLLPTVKEEVKQQVLRLKNHPCVILWNGNNEIEVAWKNWGWQQALGISEHETERMWEEYLNFFENFVPVYLQHLDEAVAYSPTSPISNWGKPENFNSSTMHYWGVWHGSDDFEGYRRNVGRFMNEYGFQSFPDMTTLHSIAKPSEMDLDSEVMKHHQKSYVGNGKILEFIRQYFGEPADFEDFVYKSQLTQKTGMDIAIRAHRKSMGHCMGTVYWQLNDTWPGPSWSSIDYYGRWKAFHYALKELYNDVLIIPEVRNDSLMIFTASDLPGEEEALVQVVISTFSGENLYEKEWKIIIPGDQSALKTSLSLRDIFAKANKNEIVAEIKILKSSGLLAATNYYFEIPKNLHLQRPAIKLNLDKKKKNLTVESKTLVKDLFISAEGITHFEKNYFDLLPGQPVHLNYEGEVVDIDDISLIFLNPD